MEHEPSREDSDHIIFDCGEVLIDVHAMNELVTLMRHAGPDIVLTSRRFDARELACITGSQLRLSRLNDPGPATLTATISYLTDAVYETVQVDMMQANDYLILEHGHNPEKFQLLNMKADDLVLGKKLANENVAAIEFKQLSSYAELGRLEPAVAEITAPFLPDTSDCNLRHHMEEVLRLWGEVHDAISKPRRGKHSELPETPAVITIPSILDY